MFRPKFALISFAIIISLFATSQVARADSHGGRQTVIFVADRAAIAQTSGGIGLARSAVGLISTLRDSDSFAFIAADNPKEFLGPAEPGSSRFDVSHDQLYAGLGPSLTVPAPDMVGALTEAYNLLISRTAPRGSAVYLVTGATPKPDLSREADRLGPILDLMHAGGWPIFGLALPGASQQVGRFLDEISMASGGDSFDLSATEGLKAIADTILRDEAKGSLSGLAEGVLSPTDVLTSPLSIAPGTGHVTILFFKEDSYGSLRLSSPSGLEASAGDRTESSVIETPHVVIWRLVDPAPGQWRVDVRGMDGAVSAWHFAANGYSVALVSYGAVPLNEPTTLVAYVTDGDYQVSLDGVRLVARITTPDGATLSYELNDAGQSGDSQAGDGYYSATIPPVTVQGSYKVELELFWPEFDHRITSQDSFRGEGFPTIDLSPVKTDELRPNERTKVATILVHVEGQPYSVSADELVAALSSNVGDAGELEVKAQRLLGGGLAWTYDVFFTPREEGLHTLNFQLSLEYGDRYYTYASDYIVLSSVMPASPTAAPVVPSQPPASQLPPVQTEPESSGFPWTPVAAVMISLAVAAAAGVGYWYTRTRPYGYLYDDHDEPVVDFSVLRRRPIMRFLFRDLIRGSELGVPGLDGVSFSFSRKNISLHGRRGAPTVRVNNQPLVGQATIYERAWIGSAGRLYSLFLFPPGFQPEPSAGDG